MATELQRRDAAYQRKRRAEGRAWDQQGANRDRVAARKREYQAQRYYQRKDAGLCTKCNQPRLSETLCWDCLSNKQTYAVTKYVNQVMDELLAKGTRSARASFRATPSRRVAD